MILNIKKKKYINSTYITPDTLSTYITPDTLSEITIIGTSAEKIKQIVELYNDYRTSTKAKLTKIMEEITKINKKLDE